MVTRLTFRSTVHGSSGVTNTLPLYADSLANLSSRASLRERMYDWTHFTLLRVPSPTRVTLAHTVAFNTYGAVRRP
jgi:hypothetical protein